MKLNYLIGSCAHCRELEPAWKYLAVQWENNPVGLVANVNCDKELKLCKERDIVGTPTLLYGDPVLHGEFLNEFGGDRDIENMSEFASEVLVPMCTIENLDPCDNEMKEKIKKWSSMSLDEVSVLLEEEEAKIKDAETLFDTQFKEMQSKYNSLSNQSMLEIARLKSRITFLENVLIENSF